jgi:hypothetical protein
MTRVGSQRHRKKNNYRHTYCYGEYVKTDGLCLQRALWQDNIAVPRYLSGGLREGPVPKRYIAPVQAVNSYGVGGGGGRTFPLYVKLIGQVHFPAALPHGKGHQFPFE